MVRPFYVKHIPVTQILIPSLSPTNMLNDNKNYEDMVFFW